MSTIRVDKIRPFQSSSVTIEGGIIQANAATTGSNTFVGSQNIQGTLTASLQEGFTLVGGVGNISTLVATSSLGGGSLPSGVVSGSSQLTASYDARYALSGSVGTAIATGSFATTGSNTFKGNQIISASVDVSGSINSDGYELDGSTTTNVLALNSTFNSDFSSSDSIIINKSLVLGDGKVLVAGRFSSIDGHTTNGIARFNSNGTIDTGFTSPTLAASFITPEINAFVTQSDDKILVGGSFSQVSGSTRLGIARLNENGTLDTSFATQSFSSFGEVRDIAIQSDNKIIYVGSFPSGSRRVTSDGTIDTSLIISTSPGFGDDDFYSVALLTSGSGQAILIGGDFQQWNSFSDYTHIVKLHPSGSLDFGFAGTNLDITIGNSLDRIKKIKVGDDGYIYVAGRFKDTLAGPNVRHAGFARLTTTDEGDGIGAFESGFRTYISGSDQNLSGVSVYVNDFDFYDGDKILLGGNFITIGIPGYSTTSANRFAIVSQTTGNLISGWSASGSASTYNMNTGSVNSVTLLPNNNVLVGGTFTSASSPLTAREGLASLKLSGYGNITTTSEYTITADSTRLLVSSSNTRFSGDVNIVGNVTASEFSGSFVGDGSGLTGLSTINTGSFATTGSNTFIGNQIVTGSVTISGSISQFGIGENNTFIGSGSGKNTLTNGGSIWNTFIGVSTGQSNIAGGDNTYIGAETGKNSISTIGNTFVGAGTGTFNISGGFNSFFGTYAGLNTGTGIQNTFVGYSAAYDNISGSNNVAIGQASARYAANGSTPIYKLDNSVFIGNSVRANADNQTNQIVIGATAIGNGSNTVVIGNTSITSTTLRGSVSASLFSGSFVGDGSGLTGIAGSINTGSFATTGSNIFFGSEIITGSLGVSGSISQKGLGGGSNIVIGEDPITNLNSAAQNNTVIGADAGALLSSGSSNVFIGSQAGLLNQIGNNNVFIGGYAGYSNKNSDNVFIGETAGFENISGNSNVFIGKQAGYNNKVNDNTFVGYQTGFANTSGSGNTFVGYIAGNDNTTGNNNSFYGYNSGRDNSVGQSNVFLGNFSGQTNTSGSFNTFVGQSAGANHKTADYNTFVGNNAGLNTGVGGQNAFFGFQAGNNNISGSENTLLGSNANALNTLSSNVTAVGYSSAYGVVTGSNSVYLGHTAGRYLSNGVTEVTTNTNSVFIGTNTKSNVNAQDNQIVIGYNAISNGTNTVTIGNNDITDTYLKGTLRASTAILAQVSSSYNFADDTAAQAGGVPLGGLYHTSGSIKIRLV